MSWPFNCKACGSRDVQPNVDEIHCLNCGRLTDKDGLLVSLDAQFTSEEKI
jgi:hypothetical protein